MGLDFEKAIDCYYGTYKKSVLAKDKITLFIYPSSFAGKAYKYGTNKMPYKTSSNDFEITMDFVTNISYDDIGGISGIIIEYRVDSIVTNRANYYLLIPEIDNHDYWLSLCKKTKEEYDNKKREKVRQEKEAEEQRNIEIVNREQEALDFFRNCYDFHIQEDTPTYELFKEKNQIAFIYIDQERGLNFLKIDGYNQEESNGVIPYEKIHYYERAGAIHYVADVHGDYSSYGGSVSGGNFSKRAAVLGGLLFGFMGMTAGALLSYKPAKIESTTTEFHIESDVQRIDERNVMLNFYSDTKKQYMDIELPQDIYNFLQTYYAEKKHNIVIEIERQSASLKEKSQIEPGNMIEAPDSTKKMENKDDIQDFKKKTERLAMMKDAGLLTEEEFSSEKAKLLSMI